MELLDDLLYDLKTLAEIKKNSRISTAKDHITIEPEGMLQFIWRFKANDSREKSVKAITTLVKTTIELADKILESKFLLDEYESVEKANRIAALHKIYDALTVALPGIRNLSATYGDDADAQYNFNKIINAIDSELLKLKNILYSSNYNYV
jgi:hypothetical protein